MVVRLRGRWESIWEGAVGRSRTRILRMESPCMSKRHTYHQLAGSKILGREDTWGRSTFLDSLMIQQRRPMTHWILVWFSIHHEAHLSAQEETASWPEVLRTSGGPTPIERGHPFVALHLADDNPHGRNVQTMKNQTAFPNTPEYKRIIPRSSGFSTVQNPNRNDFAING